MLRTSKKQERRCFQNEGTKDVFASLSDLNYIYHSGNQDIPEYDGTVQTSFSEKWNQNYKL